MTDRTPEQEYWNSVSTSAIPDCHPVLPLIASLLIGVGVLTQTSSVPAALFATAAGVQAAMKRALDGARQLDAIYDRQCYAISLDATQLREYIKDYGIDHTKAELEWARSEGLLLSDAAEAFVDGTGDLSKDRIPAIRMKSPVGTASPAEHRAFIPVPYRSEDRMEVPSYSRSTVAELPPLTFPVNSSLINSIELLTTNPASTILVGAPGTGKSFTASLMARKWVENGEHVFFIDPKMDAKEFNLWDNAYTEKHQFDGTLIVDPNEYCDRMVEAFDAFEAFRLKHLDDGKQTICVLDELPAITAAFKGYRDPNRAINFMKRIVNQLPSRNAHIFLLAQNPGCADTMDSATLSTIRKIILATKDNETQLLGWSQLSLMKSVELDSLPRALRESPIDRAFYYSVVGKWTATESLRVGEYFYDRKSLSWVGSPPVGVSPRLDVNTQLVEIPEIVNVLPNTDVNTDVNTRTHAGSIDFVSTPADTLMQAVSEYFDSVSSQSPKTIRDIRMGNRVRKIGATNEQVQEALDLLVMAETLVISGNGYISLDWKNPN